MTGMRALLWLAITIFAALMLLPGACGGSGGREPQSEPPEKQAIETAEGAGQAATEAGSHAPKHPESTPYRLPPSPAPSPPPDVRPCQAGDLNAVFAGGQGLSGGGAMVGIVLANKSSSGCMLEGTPGLQFFDAAGQEAPITAVRGRLCWQGLSCPYRKFAVLQPGANVTLHQHNPGTAGFQFTYSSHDMATGRCDPPAPVATAVRVILPGDAGTVDVTALTQEQPLRVAPCGGWVSVGWITQDREMSLYPPRPLEIEMEVPGFVRAGERSQYWVTLINIGSIPLSFSHPCPDFTQIISRGRPSPTGDNIVFHESSQLDCESIGTIDPGARITFDFSIDIPVDIPITQHEYGLTWSLGDELDSRTSVTRYPRVLPPSPTASPG